jgi:hypothetical protein
MDFDSTPACERHARDTAIEHAETLVSEEWERAQRTSDPVGALTRAYKNLTGKPDTFSDTTVSELGITPKWRDQWETVYAAELASQQLALAETRCEEYLFDR